VRRIRLLVLLTVAGIGAASLAAPAGATEDLPPPRPPQAAHDAGPPGPVMWIIGDSISADITQQNAYTFFNGLAGKHTHIEATGGTNLIENWRTDVPGWNTFVRAAQSDASTVVIELGTNDIGLILPGDPQGLQKIAKVFDYVTWTAAYLNGMGKCMVWVGMNERGNAFVAGPYNDPAVATAFNEKVRSLQSIYPMLHYANYDNLITTNATFREGLYVSGDPDTIHLKTTASKEVLAMWTLDEAQSKCGL
jgi:hypothetical protein